MFTSSRSGKECRFRDDHIVFLFSPAFHCIYETVRFIEAQIIFNGPLSLIEDKCFSKQNRTANWNPEFIGKEGVSSFGADFLLRESGYHGIVLFKQFVQGSFKIFIPGKAHTWMKE